MTSLHGPARARDGRRSVDPEPVDVLIIGAGPAGIHAACTAQDLGMSHRILDRCGIAHSFVEYPQTQRFFSPPDEMAVGGVPFPMRGGDKPTREDILPYFRAVAAYRNLDVRSWEQVVAVRRERGLWAFDTVLAPDGVAPQTHSGRCVIVATGVWDIPVRFSCPGADLPHVHYRFTEPTAYSRLDVVVVGGGNSAVYAALSLAEAYARVRFAVRRKPVAYQSHLRPFVVRDLEMALADGRLEMIEGVIVSRIEPETLFLQPAEYDPADPRGGSLSGAPYAVPARFVVAQLGQRPDTDLFRMLGLELRPDDRPVCDAETFETTAPGVYVAGSLAGQKIDIILAARPQVETVVHRVATRLTGGRTRTSRAAR